MSGCAGLLERELDSGKAVSTLAGIICVFLGELTYDIVCRRVQSHGNRQGCR